MSLLKFRGRLRSIRSLNSILAALQVVTVVRMQKVKRKFAVSEEYLKPVKEVLAGRLAPQKLSKKVLIVISSNRGLCGGFNTQILAKAKSFLTKEKGFSVVALGKRAANYFREQTVLSEFEVLERPTFSKIQALWRRIHDLNAEIYVAYNAYKSTAVQVPTIYRLYPLPEEFEAAREPANYILEPTESELTDRKSVV